MKPFSNEEKQKLLSKVAWDLDIKAGQLLQLLNDEIEEVCGFDKTSLFRRLLTTYDWHTLLKLVPAKDIKSILDDSVLDRLYPTDLKEKYLYARGIISG